MFPHMQEVTASDLEERMAAILRRVGMSYEEIAKRAESRSLAGDEWAAWEEIGEIEFLLGR
jgi:hypothetical protein